MIHPRESQGYEASAAAPLLHANQARRQLLEKRQGAVKEIFIEGHTSKERPFAEGAGAQYNLGMAYERGRGVPEDRVQAYLWLSLSATGAGEDQERRAKARDTVAVGLTPDQRAEAKRLIEEWKPKAKTPPPAEAK